MAKQTTFKNKKLKASSKNWVKRQLADPYVQKAKKEGYRSRATFKLLELNEKHHFLAPGQVVIDLGAAPGGWCQVIAKEVGAPDKGKVIAIDLLEMESIEGVEIFQGDFLDPEMLEKLYEAMGENKADGVVSDMAPNTIGHKQTDHLRLINLVNHAYVFAEKVLKPGGYFIAKLFEGGAQNELLKALKENFEKVRHVKPPASRKNSSEIYVLATGFKGS